MDTKLQNKKILVTGASRGIGRAVSKYLSLLGADIVAVARNQGKLNQLVDECKGKVFAIPFDLRNLEEIEQIFIKCKDNGIMLDGFVHCAGICELSTIQSVDVLEAKEIMDINYFSFLQLGKYFSSKKYSNIDSSIVAISSRAAKSGAKGTGAYSASKAALNNTVSVMSQEFLKRRIRVNAILPSYVNTEMMDNAMDFGGVSLEDPNNAQPLGVIEKEEIAYAVEYLLSSCSKSITGALIPIFAGNCMI